MTWAEAMGRYGTDKPDLRFGLELHDIGDLVRESGFRVFEAPLVKGLVVPPEHAAALTRNQLDKLGEFVKKRENGGAKGLAWAKIQEGGTWQAPFAKNVAEDIQKRVSAHIGATPGSILLMVADNFGVVHHALDSLRLELRDQLALLPKTPTWEFTWVTDFPMFEVRDDGTLVAAHHPFTSPRLEHLDMLESAPKDVRAQAYDLVLNGNEIGGGSIRIHQSDVQARVFAALGLSQEQMDKKFGFLLEAYKYGPPPHGGIALGVDRIAMLVNGATSLRDVIAFPKTQKGQDLMTSCPTPVDDAQLAELFLRVRPLPGAEGT
jgi:aspartyl-tRNA synthetase